ncbi:MAG: hypothetical protein S4CHLAM123_08570 [Chlamydiales bacterium]|nr:hypothetical protein [Chlamydiales bacterium]
MSEFTPDEIDGIVKAMSQKTPPKERSSKIPLRPPGSYKKLAKVSFSPIEGDRPPPLPELTDSQKAQFGSLKAHIEVVYGKTKLSLKELAALEEGSMLPLNELCDDLVDIYINGTQVARGEVVSVDGQFGVKIVTFLK